MGTVRMTLAEVAEQRAADPAKIAATTEADVQRHMREDGEVPDGAELVESPASLRARLGLTQEVMAERMRVPVKTWRNWEQGRVAIEPATRALLDLVADDPERAFQVLARRMTGIADYAEKPGAGYSKEVGGASVRSRGAVRPSQAVLDAVKASNDATAATLDATLRKL